MNFPLIPINAQTAGSLQKKNDWNKTNWRSGGSAHKVAIVKRMDMMCTLAVELQLSTYGPSVTLKQNKIMNDWNKTILVSYFILKSCLETLSSAVAKV